MNDTQRTACFLADQVARLAEDVKTGRCTPEEVVRLLEVSGNLDLYRSAREAQ